MEAAEVVVVPEAVGARVEVSVRVAADVPEAAPGLEEALGLVVVLAPESVLGRADGLGSGLLAWDRAADGLEVGRGTERHGVEDGEAIIVRVGIAISSGRILSRTTSTRATCSRPSFPTASGSARRTGSASTSARRTSTTIRRTCR